MDKHNHEHGQHTPHTTRQHDVHGAAGRLPGAHIAYNGMHMQPTYRPHTYVRNMPNEEVRQAYVQNLQNRGGDRPFMQLQHYAPPLPYMQGHYNIRPHDQRLQHGYAQYGQPVRQGHALQGYAQYGQSVQMGHALHGRTAQGQGDMPHGRRLQQDNGQYEQAMQTEARYGGGHEPNMEAHQQLGDASSDYSI